MKNNNHKAADLEEQAAKQILYALIGAFKTLNLYSESHGVYKNALKLLKKLLDDFLSRFGELRIHIQRGKIIFNDEMLYEVTTESADLVFILHRDGILWLEFQKGLELWEIDTLFKILHDHSVLEEDAEDDIVTALWEFNLPSILYEAADLELGTGDDINIADLPCAYKKDKDLEGKDSVSCRYAVDHSNLAANVLRQDGQDELWHLTPDEREQLRKMIAAEEKLDGADYVIDALLYILENHCLPEDVTELLDTLLQELREALINARFTYLLETLLKLKKHGTLLNTKSHWSVPFLERFFTSLSSNAFLNGLLTISAQVQNCDAAQLKDLVRFLLLLDKSAITTLGPLMLNIQSAKLQRILLKTIGTMAKRDFGPLEKLIAASGPDLAARLVFILGFLKDPRSRQTLSKLLGHQSEMVRRQALKAILARDDQSIKEIFPLIDDSDKRIRKLLLERLGREKNEQIENLLLRYLKKHRSGFKNEDHFIAVCRTLGRCGSDRSIPYLTRLLFKWPLLGIIRFGNSTRHRGAVIALKELKTEKAALLIERNHRGFLGNLLRSAQLYSR